MKKNKIRGHTNGVTMSLLELLIAALKKRIPHTKKIRGLPLPLALGNFWADKTGVFSSVVLGLKNTLHMISDW